MLNIDWTPLDVQSMRFCIDA